MSCRWNLVSPMFSFFNKRRKRKRRKSNFMYQAVGRRAILKANALFVMKKDRWVIRYGESQLTSINSKS